MIETIIVKINPGISGIRGDSMAAAFDNVLIYKGYVVAVQSPRNAGVAPAIETGQSAACNRQEASG